MSITTPTPQLGFSFSPVRLAIVAFVALVGLAASAWTLSAISAKGAPDLSAKLDGGNVVAQNQIALNLLGSAADPAAARKTVAVSKNSLGLALVNPEALRNLALGYAALGNATRATAMMKLAESQSRRDVGIELWMIEDSVRRGDIKLTLRYYDRALRTSPNAQTILFPILSEALTDPALAPEIARTIRMRPPWASRFVDFAVSQSPHVDSLSMVIRRAGGLPQGPSQNAEERVLLDRLSAEGHLDEALRFAKSIPGVDLAALTGPQLSAAGLNPRFAPLTWRINDAVAGAVPVAGASRNSGAAAIEINVNPDSSQIVAQKVQFLASKQFVLEAEMAFRNRSDKDLGIWELACPTKDGNVVFARSEPVRAAETQFVRSATRFSAPCNPVMLQLRTSGGSGQDPNVLTVRSVQIKY